jgi:hypothetical protein
MNNSARKINHLATCLNSRRYLEIGVNDGVTFLDVQIADRTGVDPHFRFDTSAHENERTRFMSMTSDNFFHSEPFLPSYDIVFIDGLHHFEQVVRDLSNTLLRIHHQSVILIDDTLPNDVFSTLRDPTKAVEFRQAAGLEGGAWHGDVFKIVFYLHDFWPSLSYCTIVGNGNPQTLVWRANLESEAPVFNDLEKISRLSYFDLQQHRNVLREMSEDEALALCIKQVLA